MENQYLAYQSTLQKFRLNLLASALFFFMFVAGSYGQLTTMSLTVNSTSETCNHNGSLSFTASNITPGASVVYTVYKLPDLALPVSVQSGTTLGGLSAGTYQVVAAQSLGNLSNSVQQNSVIANLLPMLSFTLTGTNAICGSGGTITVHITAGTATPLTYEIIAGPVIVSPQPLNVFTGLTPGIYQVRVNDACGTGVVQTYQIFDSDSELNVYVQNPLAADCQTIFINMSLSTSQGAMIAYPLVIHCVVYPPSGAPIIYDQTITSGSDPGFFEYIQSVPYYEGEVYSYSVTVSDNCGHVYVSNNTVSNVSVNPDATFFNSTCSDSGITVHNVTGLILQTAPPAYQETLPQDLTPIISATHSVTLLHMPNGTYTFLATGLCGQVVTLTVTVVPPPPPTTPGVNNAPGCDPGMGSFFIYGSFVSAVLNSAPAAYPIGVPQDLASFIDPITKSISMASVPEGQYIVHTVDVCGYAFDVTVNVAGYVQSTNVTVTENCNSFDLALVHTTNSQAATFWLQEFNETTGQWGHPDTGTQYPEGTIPNILNSIPLANNATTYNLGFTGIFRIMKSFKVFANGQTEMLRCNEVIYNFEFTPGPKIINLYTFQCNNDTHDLIVEAVGLAPLLYRITSKNGAPFLIENLTSSIFLALDPAIYNIQVEDACHNILNRLYNVPTPFALNIVGSNVCNGQNATLSVPDFPFLTYSWWKGTATSTVLSTNASLNFSPFNSATDEGMYHVRIQYIQPGSCIDIVRDYEIAPGSSAPQAGTGSEITYCQRPDTLDLFTLLTPPFSAGGTWQDLTGSGSLTNNILSLATLQAGTYNFKYVVTGLCSSDEEQVTVVLNESPALPQIQATQSVCSGNDISLNIVAPVGGVTYQWTGPNNFSSTEIAPTINNALTDMSGTYSVTASTSDCVSPPASIAIAVTPPPALSLMALCVDNRYTLSVVPSDNSFVAETATYAWSGPEGFSASGNPLDITGGLPGQYQVSIVTADGCPVVSQMEVAATQCTVPLGISPNGDMMNDNFNLAGFSVENLKIFNRYGMIVYEQEAYRNQWHGQDYKDRDLPAGAYYYLINLAEGEVKSGWVYVNREF